MLLHITVYAQFGQDSGPPGVANVSMCCGLLLFSQVDKLCGLYPQVGVTLDTEEVIHNEWRRSTQAHIRQLYEEHEELTSDTLFSSFTFTIPPDAPATFCSPLLTVRWLLHFTFTAGAHALVNRGGGTGR